MTKLLLILSAISSGVGTLSYAEVGPNYVCQDKLNVDIPAPAQTVDYWTNVVTAWRNTRSGQVEVFVRGPGLVSKAIEITGDATDQRWLNPAAAMIEQQGVYLAFEKRECYRVGPSGRYCYRDSNEATTPILAGGIDENGNPRPYRKALVQTNSVQALMTASQVLVSFVSLAGERITLGLACDSQDWYPHIPMDELNHSDL